MTQQAILRNPFMLLISPEVILTAVARSERLSQLNRRLCRPLDQPTGVAGAEDATDAERALGVGDEGSNES